MALDTKHPLYGDRLPDWQLLRHAFEGERRIKREGFTYLAPTPGQVQDGANTGKGRGWEAYKTYRDRAIFPESVEEAVKSALGVMHRKPPVIELPTALEPMRELATSRGESLEVLLQRVNEEQLTTGRVGLLADVIELPGSSRPMPYVGLYTAESIINWDEGQLDQVGISSLNLVVLDESSFERTQDFEWQWIQKFRVLFLGDVLANEPLGGGVFQSAQFRDTTTFDASQARIPSLSGRTLEEIPFVFVNAVDVVPEPAKPPLLGLAMLCLAIYRGEADRRQSLFMQGQDTLVVIAGSEDDEVRLGSSATINITNPNGDAKFIGVDSSGLSEQREAIDADKNEASQLAGKLLDSVSRERESGNALTVRVGARTATLNRIARAGAFGLEQLLRKVAVWAGADPDQVHVEPNLDFTDDDMTGQELAQLWGAKVAGAPLSERSVHKLMQDRGITELTYEEEQDELLEEMDTELAQRQREQENTNPNGPELDGEDQGGGQNVAGGQQRGGQPRGGGQGAA